MYAFEVQNGELVKAQVKDYQQNKMRTVYAQEALYDPNLAHLSVKFPDSEKVKKGEDFLTYGIVNEKGQIVELPTAKSRFKIYGPFVEETIGERSYSSKLYRKIGNPLVVDYDTVKSTIDARNEFSGARDSKPFPMTMVPKHKVIEYDELNAYNKNTVWRGSIYKDLTFTDRSYFMIQTEHSNYFSIIDEDGAILTDKFYSSISPFDADGIAVGTTKYSREYLDYNGNVIWMELYE
ncbi:hypothetical protein P1O00_08120 [Erysipelothrix rhusiopathiae]|nr:hypothetical protein [Erysipelothrix rhusiopathiae]